MIPLGTVDAGEAFSDLHHRDTATGAAVPETTLALDSDYITPLEAGGRHLREIVARVSDGVILIGTDFRLRWGERVRAADARRGAYRRSRRDAERV